VLLVAAFALAACGSSDEAAEVTGNTGLCDEPGEVITCQTEASDERVEGIASIDVSCDLTEDGENTLGECAGPAAITNDGGTWEGICEGTTTWSISEPAHVHDFECVYVGTGAYEGLRYVEYTGGTDYPWPITGRIEPLE